MSHRVSLWPIFHQTPTGGLKTTVQGSLQAKIEVDATATANASSIFGGPPLANDPVSGHRRPSVLPILGIQ